LDASEKRSRVLSHLSGAAEPNPEGGLEAPSDAAAIATSARLDEDDASSLRTRISTELRDAEERFKADPRSLIDFLSALGGREVSPEVAQRSLRLLRLAVDEPEIFHDYFLTGTSVDLWNPNELLIHPKLKRAYPQLDREDPDYGVIKLDPWKSKFQTTDLRWPLYARHELAGRVGHWPDHQPFWNHIDAGSTFVYEASSRLPFRVAMFADFGTGYYHSLHIARQIRDAAYPYAFHLGDVYYAGTEREFRDYFTGPVAPIQRVTQLFALPENHEMYSGGRWYQEFLRRTRPLQQGSYFCLRTSAHQIIGIDVNWQRRQSFIDPEGSVRSPINVQRAWLSQLLRDSNLTTILLTGSAPYVLGSDSLTALYSDLFEFVRAGRVHLWFWGDNHYCGLFDSAPETPFLGTCIGHGGFPYFRESSASAGGAKPLFVETTRRFPDWTWLRPDMGNNGWCAMQLNADGGVELTYTDWLSNPRFVASFEREAAASGFRLALRNSRLYPIPPEPD